jgi:hypothetical protein
MNEEEGSIGGHGCGTSLSHRNCGLAELLLAESSRLDGKEFVLTVHKERRVRVLAVLGNLSQVLTDEKRRFTFVRHGTFGNKIPEQLEVMICFKE